MVVIALLCSAVSFPRMLFERPLPIPPDPKLIAWQAGRGWYHNLKNLTTESVRADAQWWSKFLCFMVVIAFAAGLVIG